MDRLRPWSISRQLWWGHRLPVWYCDACEETYVAESAPERCGACDGSLRQEEDVLDTWFSSALWPFGVLGWPVETPELRAFYPTDVLVTARDIIFLWVARMVMMGLEFTGEIPFGDVYITSVIQAPDGRRMSKSLGTGIDPLHEIQAHGADGVRFGLLAMSSAQDVRYSADRIQQGEDLANKLWNASRLILLNASTEALEGQAGPAVVPGPRPVRVEDRWILSRLQRAIEAVTHNLDSYDFAHAALELYRFFWSELCDWYLEIVKPRLYENDPEVAATLLWILEQTLALAHPMAPFVTEEIYTYLRAAAGAEGPQMLVVHPFPEVDGALLDEAAEREVEASIELTRSVRRWRDLVGVAPGSVLPARVDAQGGEPPHELVARLARLSFDGAEGEALASFGQIEILPSEQVDAAQVRRRIADRREKLRGEVERAERKLGNQGFVSNAPTEVVEAEREKLTSYRAELEELEG
jgi:valyl-tRNA synthetase